MSELFLHLAAAAALDFLLLLELLELSRALHGRRLYAWAPAVLLPLLAGQLAVLRWGSAPLGSWAAWLGALLPLLAAKAGRWAAQAAGRRQGAALLAGLAALGQTARRQVEAPLALSELLPELLRAASLALRAESASLMLAENGVLVQRAAAGREPGPPGESMQELLQAVKAAGGEPVIAGRGACRLAVPVGGAGSLLGLMVLDRRRGFLPAERRQAAPLGWQMASAVMSEWRSQEAAESARISNEGLLAARIQALLSARQPPKLPGAAVACSLQPAAGIHRDYLDFRLARTGQLFAVLADVAGRSMNASLVMIMLRTVFQLVAAAAREPAMLLQSLNRAIMLDATPEHFAAASLLLLDPRERQLSFAGAGNACLLVYHHAGQRLAAYRGEEEPLGVDARSRFTSRQIAVNSGDVVLLYSDGIPEAADPYGNPFGRQRLEQLVAENHTLSAEDLKDRLTSAVDVFQGGGPQHDDQSLVVLKIR